MFVCETKTSLLTCFALCIYTNLCLFSAHQYRRSENQTDTEQCPRAQRPGFDSRFGEILKSAFSPDLIDLCHRIKGQCFWVIVLSIRCGFINSVTHKLFSNVLSWCLN